MIVYDDDEIQVIFHRGAGDILLVTFGPLNTLADGTDFFGRPLAQRTDLSVLGFMAKRPNWYPEANMLQALAATQELRAAYPEIVTYGSSMGGYGAAKYSRPLGASTALSLCPQWSIDPAHVAPYDRRYEQYFVAGRTGDAIRADDVSGRVYVFVDPSYAPDFGHAARIPTAELVPVHSAQHHVTGMLAGTVAFQSLLAATRRRNGVELSAAVARLRRASPRRLVEVIKKAKRRHPQWAGALTQTRAGALAANPRLLAEVSA
ncbi:hypothetical protein [Bosea sp. NBC_00550]|uniref:hypothetical protein n=1 Tax=Bosea sp. NBC_00550 TaxID=2969621 RepID=UPI002230EF54|nr:hypothetical protein [Bosea sp. NBC_00550]UZF93162.1 hypothetical protein NWE53_02785 [Bosea sp. NBC_00550]